MANAHVVLAGLDIGFGNTKVVYSVDGGPRREIIFPSGAAPERLLPVQGDGSRSHLGGRTVEMILGDGTPKGSEVTTWVAGIETHKVQNYIRPHSANFTSSQEWSALLRSALDRMDVARVDVLVAGLPVSEFFDTGRRQALRKSLEQAHRISASKTVEVRKAVIIPQPLGAYAHFMERLAAQGKSLSPDSLVLVIDPGHYSVDYVLMQDSSIHQASSGSSAMAGRQVLEAASRLLYERKQVRISVDRLEAVVRRGEPVLEVGSQQFKVSALLDEAGKLVCDQVLKGLEGVVNGVGEGLSHVVLAGGGAPLYERYVRAAFESHATLVDVAEKPILSNAYGFWQSAVSAHQLLGNKKVA